MIDGLDAKRHLNFPAIVNGRVGRAIVVCRHPRIVDLQHKSGIDDGFVLDVHGVGQCGEILLSAETVIVIVVIELQVRRRYRGDERLLGFYALERGFEICPISGAAQLALWPT